MIYLLVSVMVDYEYFEGILIAIIEYDCEKKGMVL